MISLRLSFNLFACSFLIVFTGCGGTFYTTPDASSTQADPAPVVNEETSQEGEGANVPVVDFSTNPTEGSDEAFDQLAYARAHASLQKLFDLVIVDAEVLSDTFSGFSQVNYERIRNNSEAHKNLMTYWTIVQSLDFNHFLSKDGENEGLSNFNWAFWANYYNACILLFLSNEENYERAVSYNEGLNDNKFKTGGKKVWDQAICPAASGVISLNQVEHGILRNKENDFYNPRTHYLVNCASSSCPRLSRKIFSSLNIQSLSQELEKNFWNQGRNAKGNHDRQIRYVPGGTFSNEKIAVNPIFGSTWWYQSDFMDFTLDGVHYKDVAKYISSRLETDTTEGSQLQSIANKGMGRITSFDYDWTLNHTDIIPSYSQEQLNSYEERIPDFSISSGEEQILIYKWSPTNLDEE